MREGTMLKAGDRSVVEKSAPEVPLGDASAASGSHKVNPLTMEAEQVPGRNTSSAFSPAVPTPFSDLVGKGFLLLCLFYEIGRLANERARGFLDGKIKAAAVSIGRWSRANRILASIGMGICAIGSLALFALLITLWLFLLPALVLLLLTLWVAARFGNKAGLLATAGAALLLECLQSRVLLGSLANSFAAIDPWIPTIVVLGICSSALFGKRKPASVYKPWQLP